MYLEQLRTDGRTRTEPLFRYPNTKVQIQAALLKGKQLEGFELVLY